MEVDEEDGGTRRRRRPLYKEIEEAYDTLCGWNTNTTSNKWRADEEDGGARRQARRMEVQGGGRGRWRYEEEEEASGDRGGVRT
jgi:hypothetical protein